MTKTNKPLKPPKAPLKAQATLEAPEPPKDKARQKSHLALAVARDLAFRLLERRPLSPSHLTAALTEFAKVGQVIIKNSANPGIPLLRLAGSLTAAEIDKGWLSNA
ncbi:MAG: hypothetical protein LBS60_14955, partial [Deltaproteobacteria bacterium]|nr:hypothetical protein [Deltaproteobacteria bacterium]